MLNFNSALLSSEDAPALTAFYRAVLGTTPVMEESGYTTFQAGAGWLTIGPHDGVRGRNPGPERLMLSFETEDVQAEFQRIQALGAAVVAEPYQMDQAGPSWIATLADPDGNYFQLMSPFEMG